jgi:hypothetical protein
MWYDDGLFEMERFAKLCGDLTTRSLIEAVDVFDGLNDEEKRTVVTLNIPIPIHGNIVPIHRIARWGTIEDLVKMFPFVDDVNIREGLFGDTILTVALVCDNSAKVEYILNRGVDVNATTTMGDTPSHIAALNSFEKSFEVLLKWNPNLDAVTEHLGNPMSVHDMIAVSSKNVRRSAVRHLLRTQSLSPIILGKYLFPLIAKRDYNEIQYIFSMGVAPELNASSYAKASAYISAMRMRLDNFPSYNIDDIMRRGMLDAVRIHISASAKVSWSSADIIRRSPTQYEIISLFHGTTGSQLMARDWRRLIDDEIESSKGVKHASLHRLKWFAHSLCIRGYDLGDDGLPTLRNISLASLERLKAGESDVILSSRILQARLHKDWTLIFK